MKRSQNVFYCYSSQKDSYIKGYFVIGMIKH